MGAARLLAAPFVLDVPGTQARRRAGIGKVLRWLEHHPGQSWQDRWLVSGADAAGNIAWRHRVIGWLRLPPVPLPIGVFSVSPWRTTILSKSRSCAPA